MPKKKSGKGKGDPKDPKEKKRLAALKEAKREEELANRIKAVTTQYTRECKLMNINTDTGFINTVKKNMRSGGKDSAMVITPETSWGHGGLACGNVPAEGLYAMMLALRADVKLKKLCIWHTPYGDGAAVAACLLLDHDASKVEQLELIDTGIGVEGCMKLSHLLLKDMLKITTLNMDYNNFGDAGAEQLAHGLKWNCTLKSISLAYCSIGPRGGKALAVEALGCGMLEKLNLQGNQLGAAGLEAVLASLAHNLFLTNLNVADNNAALSGDVIDRMCEAIRRSKQLREYDVRFNDLKPADATKVSDAIKLRKVEFDALKLLDAERAPPKASTSKKSSKKSSKKKSSKKGKKADTSGIKIFKCSERMPKAVFKELYIDGKKGKKKGGKKKKKSSKKKK